MEFINIAGSEVYFQGKDVNIKPGGSYKTDCQKDIGQLCLLEGLVLVGTKEHEAWEKSRAPAPEKPESKVIESPIAYPADIKEKLLAFDATLATEEGILAVADEGIYDNKKTCLLSDLLGVKYHLFTKRDDLRKINFGIVTDIMQDPPANQK